MAKTGEQIKAEVEREIEAEEQRLRDAEQQVVLSTATLQGLRAMHGPLNGTANGNGKRRGRPPKR